jgi:hypothetical protein
VLTSALDAAALEAFAVSSRALIDFVWCDRSGQSIGAPKRTDALAVDWFPKGDWDPGALPEDLRIVRERVGFGVAHISFRRIDRSEEWGWKLVDIAGPLAYWMACFVERVAPERVTADFREEVEAEIIEWRKAVDDPERPFAYLTDPPGPVGTPMHPETIASLRINSSG